MLVLAISAGKNLIQDDFYITVIESLFARLDHYRSEKRISINNISSEDREAIDKIKSKIFQKIGKITNYMELLKYFSNNQINESIALLFDYENITPSIFNGIKFTNRDIDEIVFLYYVFHKDLEKIDIDDMVKFYLHSLYNKYLIKCYKQVKTHYFKNNKETQFAYLEEKDKEIKELASSLKQKETENLKLMDEIALLSKK